ncbi:protein phosphatase 2C domain-containing protein [Candidatus Chlorohelix sp.]|uniref:protein phosphatase 2C domain-containing protein n=1 Tax=Candidatus Chlorohelix sp. TaxID=3139201 RepID=UPI00304D6E8E
MRRFKVSAGSTIGKNHTLRQANCQDKYNITEIQVNGESYLIGVVCDGCGSGSNSEVGAGLMARFLCQESARQLSKGVPIEWLPDILYRAALRYMRRVLQGLRSLNPAQNHEVIAEYLLTTALGFVMNSEKGIIFSAGDGLCVLNKNISAIDQNNTPHYLAYDLLNNIPSSFEVREFSVKQLERLAIWTDGLDPQLLPSTWGHSHPRGLQRQLNVHFRKGRLEDDTTGIVVERVA